MTEANRMARAELPAIRRPDRRRNLLIGCGLALALLTVGAVAFGWYYWFECQRRPNVPQVQALVDSSGPLPGSSVGEVTEWLNSHGIQNREESLSYREWNTWTAEEVGGPEVKDAQRVVIGFFLDAYVDPIFSSDIFIYFYFDAKGRLFKTIVKGWSRCC